MDGRVSVAPDEGTMILPFPSSPPVDRFEYLLGLKVSKEKKSSSSAWCEQSSAHIFSDEKILGCDTYSSTCAAARVDVHYD